MFSKQKKLNDSQGQDEGYQEPSPQWNTKFQKAVDVLSDLYLEDNFNENLIDSETARSLLRPRNYLR